MGRYYSAIAWIELFGVLLLGIPILLPGRIIDVKWHSLILIALFAAWLLRWLYSLILVIKTVFVDRPLTKNYKSGDLFNPLRVLLYLTLISTCISLWASADRTVSLISAGYLLFGVALFTALMNWPPVQHNVLYNALFLLLVGTGLAILSPPLVAWKPEFRLFYLPLYDRLTAIPLNFGETIHANVLAGALVLILPILFALTWQKFYRYLAIFLFLFVSTILVLTQSRAGYLAIAVALPLVVLLRWPRFLYGLLPVLVALVLFLQQAGVYRLLDQFGLDGAVGGWQGRLDIWRNSLLAISDFAFTGIGIGTFTLVMPLLYPLQVSVEEYPHAHNLFLQIGLDLGLPGLVAYLAIIINLVVMLIATLRSRYTLPLHRTLAIGATGSLVGMLIHGLLDAVTWGTKLAFVPWILFALITQLFLYTQATQATHKAASAVSNNAYPGK
jgi:putative inorganic carbon (HCO3(-)) transporter